MGTQTVVQTGMANNQKIAKLTGGKHRVAIKTHGTMLALQERRKTESTNLQLQAMIKPHVDAGGQQSIKNVPLWVAEAIMNFHPTALSHRVSLEMQKCSMNNCEQSSWVIPARCRWSPSCWS